MMQAVLTRIKSNDIQTLGCLDLYDGIHRVFSCKTLELPDLNNQPQKSRIPEGDYSVVYRKSPSQGDSYHVQDVPGREWILIHKGNFYFDILGCILVGQAFSDVNEDGEMDVTSSLHTLTQLLGITKEFQLKIIDVQKS